MGVRIVPEAEQEVSETATWYEAKEPGLGTEFTAAVRHAFSQIEKNPEQYAKLETNRTRRDYRRFLMNRFRTW